MITTKHILIHGESKAVLEEFNNNVFSLIIANPPSPMLFTWDKLFQKLIPPIKEMYKQDQLLTAVDANNAHLLIHAYYKYTWDQYMQLLKRGALPLYIITSIGR